MPRIRSSAVSPAVAASAAIAAFALSVGFAAPAAACDVCSIFNFVGAKNPGRGWYAGLHEQYADFGTLVDGGDEVDNTFDQSLESSVTQAFLGYQFGERFGLQLTIPYIRRDYRRVVEAEAEEHEHEASIHRGTYSAMSAMSAMPRAYEEAVAIEEGSVSGLGDVALLVQFRAFERHDTSGSTVWSAFVGVELPTGDTDELADGHDHGAEEALTVTALAATGGATGSSGDLVALPLAHGDSPHGAIGGHDLALGSGSVDLLVGTKLFLSRGRWYGEGSAQYAFRREGDFDFRFGDELSWSLQAGRFLVADHATNLSLGVQLSGEERAEDREGGAVVEGSDLSAIYAGPALQLSHGRFFGELELDLPVRQESGGELLVPDWRLRLALSTSF